MNLIKIRNSKSQIEIGHSGGVNGSMYLSSKGTHCHGVPPPLLWLWSPTARFIREREKREEERRWWKENEKVGKSLESENIKSIKFYFKKFLCHFFFFKLIFIAGKTCHP